MEGVLQATEEVLSRERGEQVVGGSLNEIDAGILLLDRTSTIKS